MINSTFYPTPRAVIDKMLAPLIQKVNGRNYLPYRQILEPSAGKGDIADCLVNFYRVEKTQVFCVEVEPELQMILTGKGYKVIDSDFLCYGERYYFDLIVMNPPWDEGVDHLLKAWDVISAGDIVCVLNAETVLNAYTEKRKLLKRIIDQHGMYENIGAAFKNAERSTNAECVIVWLHKGEKGSTAVSFDGILVEHEADVPTAEFSANPLANANIIEALVDQYDQAARLLVEIHDLTSQYRFYTQGVTDNKSEERRAVQSLNEKIDQLKKSFWDYIFEKTKLGQATTSNFRKKFDEFAVQTSHMAFSVANIMHVLELFFLNHEQIVKECILDVFDKATSYHEKNIIHTEGWKTNKSWKIAPKVIIPNGVEYEPKWENWSLRYGWSRDFLGDVDKALCFLSGKTLDSITTLPKAIDERLTRLNHLRYAKLTIEEALAEPSYDDVFESTFFTIRLFKKGTVHVTFKDKDLLAQLNKVAAEGKNWVGAGY